MWKTSLLVLALSSTAAAETWWNAEWDYRRTVTTGAALPRRPASDVVVAEIASGGKALPDGADIRVFDAAGAVLPCKVLSRGDDRLLVAFPGAANSRYTVYYGNDKARAPKAWEPEAGLIMEVRERPEGSAATWEDMKKLLEKPGRVYGNSSMHSISLGFNPLGPQKDVILSFSGWIQCPADGSYEFATNSWDASFLLVDGTLVAQWGGWHSPAGGERAGHSGKITLRPGRHHLEYYNAVRNTGFGISAGWRPPGAERLTPIPTEAWVGGFIALPGAVQARTGPPPADFSWIVASDLGLEAREVTCFTFSGRAVDGIADWHWDFGDGTTGAGQNPMHVFLENGMFAVRLDTTMKDGTVRSITNRIAVQPQLGAWGGDPARKIQIYGGIVKSYPAEKLTGKAALEMGRICVETGDKDAALAALERAVAAGGVDPRNREDLQTIANLFDLYREKHLLEKALALAETFSTDTTIDPQARAAATVRKGEILLELGRLDPAQATFRLVAAQGGKTDYARLAHIHEGDVLLERGRRDEAAEIYREVETGWKRTFGDIDVSKGNHSVAFHSYLRSSEFEAADKEIRSLIWETPTAQLTGTPRFLTGKLREAQKRWAEAETEYVRATEIDPSAPHVPEALLRLSAVRLKMDKKAEARAALEKCVKEYPESPEADAAQKLLDGMK